MGKSIKRSKSKIEASLKKAREDRLRVIAKGNEKSLNIIEEKINNLQLELDKVLQTVNKKAKIKPYLEKQSQRANKVEISIRSLKVDDINMKNIVQLYEKLQKLVLVEKNFVFGNELKKGKVSISSKTLIAVKVEFDFSYYDEKSFTLVSSFKGDLISFLKSVKVFSVNYGSYESVFGSGRVNQEEYQPDILIKDLFLAFEKFLKG